MSDDDDDGFWVSPGKSLDSCSPLRGISEQVPKGGGHQVNPSNVKTASTTPGGHLAVTEAWKEIYMSAGREIVTLHGSLYRGSGDTLSITLGKWGSEATKSHLSNHPSGFNHCVSCARCRRGVFPAPSCLGLKVGFHAGQLAGLLSTQKRPSTVHAGTMQTVSRCWCLWTA